MLLKYRSEVYVNKGKQEEFDTRLAENSIEILNESDRLTTMCQWF